MGQPADVRLFITLAAVPGGCPACGVHFAVPSELLKKARENLHRNARLYCPNGHSMSWHKTEVDRLRAQLASVERDRDWAKQGRDRALRQVSAHKGQVTRIKNRIKNGVCPCCKRSFENLARHMASKHPDFAPDNTEGDAQIA